VVTVYLAGFIDLPRARRDLALRVREHVVRTTRGGGCFLGASLAAVELLVGLHTRVRPRRADRDLLLLAKGHAELPALYATLAEIARTPTTFDVPGVEVHAGSLGQVLAIGAHLAAGAIRRGSQRRVYVYLGDGDLDDGLPAAFVAPALGLTNLVAIIARPGGHDDPGDAFASWHTLRIDGHDARAIDDALEDGDRAGRPVAIVADTERNRGLPSLASAPERWFARRDTAEMERLVEELHRNG
jgi:transketolase